MSISARITKAEGQLGDALLWFGAQELAAELDKPAEDIFAEAREVLQKYGHLERLLPNGKVDMDPFLQAMAAGEGLDYDELVRDVKRYLRRQRDRERRRRP